MIHVGDHHEHDIQAAQAAGVRAVWFNREGKVWPGAAAPDAEFGDFGELPRIIAALDAN